MSEEGYLSDTPYPDTSFPELAPAWINYVATIAGFRPVALDRPFTYLELGCGSAGSTLTHAASSPAGRFYACDINEAAIAQARARARENGVQNVTLQAASFAELRSADLPPFDFVVAHGVYSWVDAGVRQELLELARALLAPHGFFYVSYNCQPGWSAEVPMRRLMVELDQQHSDDVPRTEAAIDRLERLQAAGFGYFDRYPEAGEALRAYRDTDADYLVHEFFNPAWKVAYSSEVHRALATLGFGYVGSATLADNHPELCFTEAMLAEINAAGSTRELVADFALNRRFRRDVFHAGAPPAGDGALGETRLSLNEPIPDPVTVPRGVLGFDAAFMDTLAEHFRQSGHPVRLADLTQALAAGGAPHHEIARNLVYLTAAGVLSPCA